MINKDLKTCDMIVLDSVQEGVSSMIIAHNMLAINSENQLRRNEKNSSNAIEKLSSGLRINKAADDAAGLAISEKMRAQIRGLSQAARNVQDGISLLHVAEGGISSITDSLQRMRELVVQGANDTYTNSDRECLQQEIEQLKKNIDGIANNTEFNTIKILNGSISGFTETIQTISPAALLIGGSNEVPMGTSYEYLETEDEHTGILVSLDSANSIDVPGDYYIKFYFYGKTYPTTNSIAMVTISKSPDDINIADRVYTQQAMPFESISDLDIQWNGMIIDCTGVTYRNPGGAIHSHGFGWHVQLKAAETEVVTIPSDNNICLQVGANAGQNFSITIDDMTIKGLGIEGNWPNVLSSDKAQSSFSYIDKAIAKANGVRGRIGAYHNSLERIAENLGNSEENLTTAESRIRDLDMAREVMELTKFNILIQASQSMLAQANQQPQSVLNLFR
jgi:flagellin